MVRSVEGAIHINVRHSYVFFILVILTMLAIPGQASDLVQSANHLSLGHGHSCALINNKVTCWGSNLDGERDVPESLLNPHQISIGGQDSCALDDFNLTCWGLNGLVTIATKNATDLSRNVFHTCVIEGLILFCFGSGNYFGELDVPADLVNPRRVAAGVYHTCALDDEGVKCWGDNLMGATDVPQLNSPTQIIAGGSFSCALDSSELKCWGANDNGELEVPSLVNPRQISAGYNHICALDDSGVQCWGANGSGQSDVPSLINPTNVAAGAHQSCALDGNEIICWGYNGLGQTEPDDVLVAEYFASDPASSKKTESSFGVANAIPDGNIGVGLVLVQEVGARW